jgi:AAA domain
VSAFDDLVAAIEQHTGRPGRPNGKHVRLLCPGHDDHHPSLDVAEGDDGRPLVYCRSHSCTYEQILAAVGIEPLELHTNGAGDDWTPFGPAVAVYRYVDEQNRLLFEVCRTADKQFPQRRPDPTAKSGWRWKLDGTRRVLYRLPEVIAAVSAGQPIYIPEGEKDVDRLRREGLVATCSPGGAGKWSDSYAQTLAGARVIVIADRDPPGYAHARRIARSLDAVDAEVTLRQPAVDLAGADVSDHLAAGHGIDELEPLPIDAGALALRVVSIAEFAAVDEPGAEAILGTTDNAVIPEGGDTMVYGDGGVGKTTLCVDLVCHLAAGDNWLGLTVPRPVRILLIENEGPRPLFRRKLERKLSGWQGSPLHDRIQILEEPWGELDFADPTWRDGLARVLAAREIDVLVVGPLTSIGMEGAGTIAEARAFLDLVDDVRTLSGRPVAVLLVHHENKGGKVSGAWEGAGDTLIHVQQQGHGKIRLYFQKARWASDQHATTLQLAWADRDSFELADDAGDEANRPERTWNAIADYVLENGGTAWGPVAKAVKGEGDYLARRRDALLEAGVIVNAGTGKKGAPIVLWHRDDPACPVPLGTPLRGFSDPENGTENP